MSKGLQSSLERFIMAASQAHVSLSSKNHIYMLVMNFLASGKGSSGGLYFVGLHVRYCEKMYNAFRPWTHLSHV